jgi:hypothetical protein
MISREGFPQLLLGPLRAGRRLVKRLDDSRPVSGPRFSDARRPNCLGPRRNDPCENRVDNVTGPDIEHYRSLFPSSHAVAWLGSFGYVALKKVSVAEEAWSVAST